MTNEVALDALDRRILEILQQDGRKTFAEIGALVGLSAPSAHQRVKKLEQRGVIRRYSAVVDAGAADYRVLAFILVVQTAHADWDEMGRSFAAIPEITECHHVAGVEDYLLKVRARDTLDLERVLQAVRADPHVDATRTMVVLSSPFEDRGLPLPPGDAGRAGAEPTDAEDAARSAAATRGGVAKAFRRSAETAPPRRT